MGPMKLGFAKKVRSNCVYWGEGGLAHYIKDGETLEDGSMCPNSQSLCGATLLLYFNPLPPTELILKDRNRPIIRAWCDSNVGSQNAVLEVVFSAKIRWGVFMAILHRAALGE